METLDTVREQKATYIVPNYESFVLLHVRGIVDALDRGRAVEALQRTQDFYLALSEPVKNTLEMDYLKIEIAKEIVGEKRGVTAFQTRLIQHQGMNVIANLYVRDFLDKIVNELYARDYLEKKPLQPFAKGGGRLRIES
jgi:hypothetical protein